MGKSCPSQIAVDKPYKRSTSFGKTTISFNSSRLISKYLLRNRSPKRVFVFFVFSRKTTIRLDLKRPKKSFLLELSMASIKRKRHIPKFYAVRAGHQRGVFATWEDCKAQTAGYSGAVCKCLLPRHGSLYFARGFFFFFFFRFFPRPLILSRSWNFHFLVCCL